MEHKELIEELYFCAAQCLRCYDACLLEKEKDKLERCMMMDQDCTDICRLTGQILERNSENANMFLKLCAEICDRCAAECEKHSHMDHCKKCAEVCRKCAAMCRSHQSVQEA